MAKGSKQVLSASRELNYARQKDPLMGSLFQKIIGAVNTLAKNSAVSAVGKLSPPPPPDSVQVQGTFDKGTNTITAPGEILHFTVQHNAAIQKGIQYISELSNDPSFSSPHVLDHGSSRTGPFLHLPTTDSQGFQQTYYLRTMAQYHGSDPSEKTIVGGLANPTKIVMSGSTSMDLLPSEGSGTAKNGQQGGQGLGTTLNRPAPRPKRSVSQ